jgi:hypothetical protein
MSRALPAAFDAALNEPRVHCTILIEAMFPGDPVRIFAGHGKLACMDREWTGVGDMLAIDAINETTDTAQVGVGVTFSGIPSSLYNSTLLNNYADQPASIWLAIFEPGTQDLVSDPVLLFEGVMDSDVVEDSGSMCSIKILAVSDLHDHLRPRVFRYTAQDQATLHGSGDRGLDFMPGLQNAAILWRPPTS